MTKAMASAMLALAVSAAAATDYDSTGFEYENITLPSRVAADDGTILVNDAAFVALQSDWSEIRGYSESEDPAPGESAEGAYLHVDNNDPLCRVLNGDSQVQVGDGLFIDMLVRFGASDVVPDVVNGDKISVWAAEDAEGTRTFVVSAGYVENSLTDSMVRHYAVTAGSVVPDDGWHRLVVKAYSKVGESGAEGSNFPVFTVFIDDEPATIDGVFSFDADGLVSVDSTDRTVGPVQFFYPAVTDVVLEAKLAANQLFPSYVAHLGSSPATLKRVCFVGEGDVDCYAASDVDPAPETYETASLAIEADEGITVAPATSFSGLQPGASVPFTVTLADGYRLVGATFNGVGFAASAGQNELTMPSPLLVPSYTLKIRAAQLLATVGDTSYDSLRDAVEAAIESGEPVVLNRDAEFVNDGDFEDDVSVWIGSGNSVTIDLNGYSLGVVFGDDPSDFCADIGLFDTNGGSLTIQDSSAGKTGRMTAADGLCVVSTGYISANEVLTIQGGIFDGPISEGEEAYTLTISGGSFLKTAFSDGEGAFAYAGSVAKGKVASSDGSYWKIVDDGDDPGEAFPSSWNGGSLPSQDIVDKFATWSQTNDSTAENAEQAFLLNVAPAADLDIEPLAIKVEGGAVTITTNRNLKNANGVVYVLWGTEPDAVTNGAAGSVDDDGAVVNLDGASPRKFFKVGVGYSVPSSN